MAKKVLHILSLALALVTALMLTGNALGAVVYAEDGRITYSGNSRSFVFGEDDNSPADLFNGFKSIMPGDTANQKLYIKNDPAGGVKIRIYLRSLGAVPGSEEFLSKLKLTVTAEDGRELFSAPADQTAGLTEWNDLGLIYSGGEVQLNLSLDMPLELGNEYQDVIGQLNWEFKVEEFPVEATDPHPPKTGDSDMSLLWGAVALLSLFILLIIVKRKKDEDDETEVTEETEETKETV